MRTHWAIENCLHWVLDVTMNEDRQRNRKEHGPENLAMLRRLALNIARREPTKDAMRGKLKRAAWNDDDPRRCMKNPKAIAGRAAGRCRPGRRRPILAAHDCPPCYRQSLCQGVPDLAGNAALRGVRPPAFGDRALGPDARGGARRHHGGPATQACRGRGGAGVAAPTGVQGQSAGRLSCASSSKAAARRSRKSSAPGAPKSTARSAQRQAAPGS